MRGDTKTDIPAATGKKLVQAELPVRLYEGSRNCFTGITRDVSTSGFSAFLEHVSSDSNGDEDDYSSPEVDDIRERLSGRKFYAVIEVERRIVTSELRVTSAERSLRAGFEVFVVFSSDDFREDDWSAVADYVAKGPAVETETEVIRLDHVRVEPNRESPNEREDVHIVFRARYFYIAYMRDLCDKLAVEMGFGEDEVFELKLVMDEVLTNAIEHGCTNYGEDRIDVKICFHEDGICVRVRDPGGKGFDGTRYKDNDKTDPGRIRSGLCLVDKFTDRWEVNTRPDEYTEVVFFKNKLGKERE